MTYIPNAGTVHLSRDFTLAELVRTSHGRPEDNYPTTDRQMASLTLLCTSLLQPTRDQWGPLVVGSGFRSPAVNEMSGGSTTSQHLDGEAADFWSPRPDVLTLAIFRWLAVQAWSWGQLIFEHPPKKNPWIHISLPRPGLYRQTLVYDGEGYRTWARS